MGWPAAARQVGGGAAPGLDALAHRGVQDVAGRARLAHNPGHAA